MNEFNKTNHHFYTKFLLFLNYLIPIIQVNPLKIQYFNVKQVLLKKLMIRSEFCTKIKLVYLQGDTPCKSLMIKI